MAIASSIFKSFDTGSDIVTGRIQSVSTGLWGDGVVSQSSGQFFISPSQAKNTGSNNLSIGNGAYYWDVYNKENPDTNLASERFFSIAYGNKTGAGSGAYDVSTTMFFPTKAIYSQYKNLLLLPDDTQFSFITGSSLVSTTGSDDIYVLNFSSEKYKQRLDPGQFQLEISGSSGSFSFIDDSIYQATNNIGTNKTVYNIVRGTISGGPTLVGGAIAYEAVGLLYPTVGIVVLNPSVVSKITGIPEPVVNNTTTRFSNNQSSLLYGVSGTGSIVTSSIGPGIRTIIARDTEYIPTRHYFVRVKNQEFNYSNNPSFVRTGSDAGKWRFDDFANDPKTYITTVGLYNENNDLLAVAKLSQPLQKSFDNEALIKVQLSW
jgi:hypothetical protein